MDEQRAHPYTLHRSARDNPDGPDGFKIRAADSDGLVSLFDALVGDVVLARGLDLAERVGRRTAYDLAGRVHATGGRGITVNFPAIVDTPVVSGVDVRRV